MLRALLRACWGGRTEKARASMWCAVRTQSIGRRLRFISEAAVTANTCKVKIEAMSHLPSHYFCWCPRISFLHLAPPPEDGVFRHPPRVSACWAFFSPSSRSSEAPGVTGSRSTAQPCEVVASPPLLVAGGPSTAWLWSSTPPPSPLFLTLRLKWRDSICGKGPPLDEAHGGERRQRQKAQIST